MADKTLTGPVGRRWQSVDVANRSNDQSTVIELLTAIPAAEGGRKEAWVSPPPPGPDGTCPQALVDAIWAFQVHWRDRGVFTVIDNVVDPGMNTLRKLNALAPDPPPPEPIPSVLVSRTHRGGTHDHAARCALPKWGDPTYGPDGRLTHIATPLNPQRSGRMVNVGGMQETAYLGFEDYVPDPAKDPSMPSYAVLGRPFTTTIEDDAVSDIFFRSAPLDKWMREVELPRICAVGCRLTYAANAWALFARVLPYLRTLGPIIHQEIIYEEPNHADFTSAWHVPVVIMLHHKRPRKTYTFSTPRPFGAVARRFS